MDSNLGRNKSMSIYGKVLLSLFVGVGFLEKIHDALETVLVLDGIITIMAFVYVVVYFSEKKSFNADSTTVPLLLFTFFILFSSLVGGSSWERVAVALFALVECWAFGIIMVENRRSIKRIFLFVSIAFLIYSFVYSLISLLQGMELQSVRYDGLSDQSNSLGVMAALSVLVAMVNFRRWGNIFLSILWNLLMALLIPFYLYVLVMSDSRTSFFALLFGCLFLSVLALVFTKPKSPIFWAIIPALLVVVAAVVGLLSSDRSINAYTIDTLTSGRTKIWGETFSVMGLKEYVLGFSGNTNEMYRALKESGASYVTLYNQGERHLAHNMYMGVLFEYGAIPALTFIVVWIGTMVKGVRNLGKGKRGKRETIASLSILSFFVVHSIAESSIFFIGGTEQLLFIFSLSIIYGLCRGGRR